MKPLVSLIPLVFAGALHAAEPATVDAAIATARKAHSPVLLDFSAPWCYSCYFMETHVLNGAEWNALEAKVVVAPVDADSPDGAAWMKKLEVKALPAYVVLDENGAELGRILAEQTRDVFYPAIGKIIAGASTLDLFKAKAATSAARSSPPRTSMLRSVTRRPKRRCSIARLPPFVRSSAAT